MRKYLIWIIPLILIVSGVLQFACSSGGGGATIPDATYDAKYPPRNFDWEEGNRVLTVWWDPVPLAIGYRIYLCKDGGDFNLYSGPTPVSQNQIIITGLSNGKSYYIGVSAVGSTMVETIKTYPGGYPLAEPLVPTSDIPETLVGFPPAAPKNLQGYAGDMLVHLDWDPNTEPDFDKYTPYRAREYTDDLGTYLSPYSVFPSVSVNSYDDDDVINGIMYYYFITATDIEPLESGPSNIVKYRPMSSPPLMPANLTATFSAFSGIIINWNKTFEQDIRHYRIFRYDWTDGDVHPLEDTVVLTLNYPEDPFFGVYPPFADGLVESGHIYEYWVAAQDVEGQFGPAAVSEKVQVP